MEVLIVVIVETAMPDVTRILNRIEEGDPRAADELLPIVYGELRRLAARRLDGERPGQTLQPTALVHEAYLRLVGEADPEWDGRGHFFASAAEAMRRILVEKARRKARLRHGGNRQRVEFDPAGIADVADGLDYAHNHGVIHRDTKPSHASRPRTRSRPTSSSFATSLA